MKKYFCMLRINFLTHLQYRAAAYAGMTTQFFWGFMTLLMFRAFYQSDPQAFPMEFSQLANYIWMQQAFLALFFAYQIDNGIFNCIIDGNVAYELCRPVNLYSGWLFRSMGTRLSRAALRCLPILLVASLLPEPFCMTAPADMQSLLLFMISMPLAFIVSSAFMMLIYVSAFHTVSPNGIRMVISALTDFLMGGIIPLPFFPQPLLRIVGLLPFASMQNVPLRIYSGAINPVQPIILQIIWAIVLLFLGQFLMKRAAGKVVVQGG